MAIDRARELFLFSLISCLIFLIDLSSSESDTSTLEQAQKLFNGQQLVSFSSGIFKLGFFNPYGSQSLYHYLGIWYNNGHQSGSTVPNPVWVANRNNPILNINSVFLVIDENGNLKIQNNDGTEVIALFSTPQAATITKASATLQDDGNFVLNELNPDGTINRILWQSFDYPTDTLLPGMKLGINFKTGFNWSLTSWRSSVSASSGSFTLGLDPNRTDQLVIWWRGEVYWTSGPWQQAYSNFQNIEFLNTLGCHVSYVSNENETYFNYSVYKRDSIFPMISLNYLGELHFLGVGTVSDKTFSCRSLDHLTVGCVEEKPPNCWGVIRDVEFQSINGFMSRDGFKFSESDNLTLPDCEAKCLHDCSCFAYGPTNEDLTGCEIWSYGAILQVSGRWPGKSRELYVIKSRDHFRWFVLAVVIVIMMVTLPLCYICFSICPMRNIKGYHRMASMPAVLMGEIGLAGSGLPSMSDSTLLDCHSNDGSDLHIFSFDCIAAASNNFCYRNKLGEGGFGPVYKGKLGDGQEVAIKRLSRNSGQGIAEFKNEAMLIAKLQHTNLVRLLGYCIQEDEKLLVYEYMPNKSLDSILFDNAKRKILNWKRRLTIIEGIAQGLLYLHKYSRLKVIHRDLKASNILLDAEMNPKISDFGMARIFGFNQSETNTNRVVGTYGYMSPEYAFQGLVSIKTDVFSFGVLILEIVSGKKNYGRYHHSDFPLNLVGYAWQLWNEGKGLELMDPTMDELCPRDKDEVLRCVHIGLLCVQDHATDRPTTSNVVSMLSNETMPLPIPKQPSSFISSSSVVDEPSVPKNKLENCSINYLTISMIEPR